jgi:hypothetical protein
MTNLQILQLMWLGMQYPTFNSTLQYGEFDLTETEADDWMNAVQHHGGTFSLYVDDSGTYRPCIDYKD